MKENCITEQNIAIILQIIIETTLLEHKFIFAVLILIAAMFKRNIIYFMALFSWHSEIVDDKIITKKQLH